MDTFVIQGRMKKYILLFTITLITSSTFSQVRHLIPIQAKNNRTYITVKIGELIIPNILLDTGFASDGLMLFNPAYRDSLDVNRLTEVRIGGAGSGDDATALMVEGASFSLGDLEISNKPVIILRNNPGFYSNGIIGYSIFGHYITEFNYDNNTMTLCDPGMAYIDNSWKTIPIYFKNNRIPWIDASVVIDKKKPVLLSMYIDYAAGDAIVLLEKPGMKFSLPDDIEDILIGRGLSGDIYGKSGRISKLIIGPFELSNIKASFAPAEIRSKQDNADAILGNESLRRFNLIFDYLNKKLYLKPNSHFSDPYN